MLGLAAAAMAYGFLLLIRASFHSRRGPPTAAWLHRALRRGGMAVYVAGCAAWAMVWPALGLTLVAVGTTSIAAWLDLWWGSEDDGEG
jgi:hypothetical protein